MSLTNTCEELIGAHLLRSASWSKPGALYLALLKSDPGEAGTVDEVSGGAYTRKAAGPSDSDWNLPVEGNKTFANAIDLSFPVPSADWGYVTHFAVMDASTGGVMLAFAPLSVPRMIYGTDPAPVFAAGDLRLVFSGVATDALVEQIGTHLLRTGSWAKPSGVYVALMADTASEVSGGGYVRQAAGPSDGAWTGPSGGDGEHHNAAAIVWSSPGADWGHVDAVQLFDASSAGTALVAIPLVTARNILAGALAPNFAVGDLALSFD